MSISSPSSETETALHGAYLTLGTSKDAPGKVEQKLDKIGNAISNTSDSPTLTFLNEFYTANSAIISSAAAGLSSVDNKTIDNAISGFSESVKVVMNGLDALGHVHPFIAVAVVAFKLVVTLDLTRRENNQKVLAVKVQMQQMMCTLFQLRRIKDPEEIGPDGTVLKDRMQPLMEQIAHDIKECGSACDVYLRKSLIVKTLKSKTYEGRLTDYAAKFMDYKDELDKTLTVHIALGVDAATEKLVTQATKLESIEEKLDMLTNVFRKLDTPRERDIMEFVEENGGAQAVVERNDLVQALVDMAGEKVSNLADKARIGRKTELDSVREKFKKELAEDVDAVFKQNFTLFDRKLEIQGQNIMDAIEKQGQYIVNVLSAGTYDKIKDQDLRNLWREMDWTGSVKARHFVLALRDYFTNQFSDDTPRSDNLMVKIHFAPTTANRSIFSSTPLPIQKDQWALQYVNVSKLNAILEAIDDDGMGYISIKEANIFANDRPKGWGLLHWIAFWAQGWETSLADYRNKILLILQEMDRIHENVLVENRRLVDLYLTDLTILSTHDVLRSIKLEQDYDQVATELLSISQAYTTAEEQRLQKNLENIDYDLDSPATVALVTGFGRIERYLFPLLYLVLKRHLEAFHFSQRHIIAGGEFDSMTQSLESIFGVVGYRIHSLRAIYKHAHLDPNAYLANCYFGMFHDYAVHESNIKTMYAYGPEPSLIMTWEDTSKTKNESEKTSTLEHTENAKPLFPIESMDRVGAVEELHKWPLHSFDINPMTGRIDGLWAGHLWSTTGKDPKPFSISGLMQLKLELDPIDDSSVVTSGAMLTGSALGSYSRFQVLGRWRRLDYGAEDFDLLVSRRDTEDYCYRLVGSHIENDETLVGTWSVCRDGQMDHATKAYHEYPFSLQPSQAERISDYEIHKSPEDRQFLFRRTPAEVAGFWKLDDGSDRKDAKKRWNFLRHAVLYFVRRQLWSTSHIKAWRTDRHTLVDLYRRELLIESNIFSKPITPEEEEVFFDLRYRLCASNVYPRLKSLTWSLDRLAYQYSIICDGCDRILLNRRFVCLTCLDSDMCMSLDLCPDCVDKPVGRDGFTHTPEHTLLKFRQFPQPYAFAWFIREGRSISQRLKKILGEASPSKGKDKLGIGEHHAVSSALSMMVCTWCKEPVEIPCWVCVVCAPDLFVCKRCEEEGEKPGSSALLHNNSHSVDHPLLRLHNLIPDHFDQGKVNPVVTRINELEDMTKGTIADLETSVKGTIMDLDNRVASLEAQFASLHSKVEERLMGIESLLSRIAVQLNVNTELANK